MGVMVGVVAGLVVGFLAGLWAFRVKSRWCPACGPRRYGSRTATKCRRRVRRAETPKAPIISSFDQ